MSVPVLFGLWLSSSSCLEYGCDAQKASCEHEGERAHILSGPDTSPILHLQASCSIRAFIQGILL